VNNLVKIGVVSDTHMPKKSKNLPRELVDGITGVDLIIHAGDINEDTVIYELESIAPVEAVAGNTDDEFMLWSIGREKIITIEKIKIGIVHGDGSKGTTIERVQKNFENEKLNCIVFGHSHIPMNEIIDGVLYFNPGSPTDKRTQNYFSYGIITVWSDVITGEILFF
jgi:hypothetical protein